MKARGVLGGDDGDLKDFTLLNRTVRYGLTVNGWPFLGWEVDRDMWRSSRKRSV